MPANEQHDVLRHRSHKWSTEERAFLLFAKRLLLNSWEELGSIFNYVFAYSISKSRLYRKLPKTSLSAQYHELVIFQDVEYEAVYERVHFQDLRNTFEEFNRKLEGAAQSLGVDLHDRDEDDYVELQRHRRKSRKGVRSRKMIMITSEPNLPTSSDNDNKETTQAREAPAVQEGSVPKMYLPTPPTTPTKRAQRQFVQENVAEHPSHDGVPYVLFRVFDKYSHGYNSSTQFIAGSFVHDSSFVVGAPPDTNDERFLKWAGNHLDPGSSTPSPFISLTTSFVWAVHRAIKRFEQQHNVYIAVLDGRSIVGNTRLYYTRDICRQVKVTEAANFRYKSVFEYWAWKAIREQAIIGCFSISELLTLAISFPDMNTMLRLNQIGRRSMSMGAILRSFQPIPLDWSMAVAIAKLLKLVYPSITFHHYLVRDLIRVLQQNFKLLDPGDMWAENGTFLTILRQHLAPDGDRRMETFRGVMIPLHSSTSCFRALQGGEAPEECTTSTLQDEIDSDAETILGTQILPATPVHYYVYGPLGPTNEAPTNTTECEKPNLKKWLYSPYE